MNIVRVFLLLLITTFTAYSQNNITEGKINSLLPGKWIIATEQPMNPNYIKLESSSRVSSFLINSYITIKSDGTITKTNTPNRKHPRCGTGGGSTSTLPRTYTTNWEVKYPENIITTESSIITSSRAHRIISISSSEVVLQPVSMDYLNYIEVYIIKDTVTDDKIINLLPGTWKLVTSKPNSQGIIKLVRDNENSNVRYHTTVIISANGVIEVNNDPYFRNRRCLNGGIKARIYKGYWNMEYTGNIFTTSVAISCIGKVYKIISLTEDELLLMCY